MQSLRNTLRQLARLVIPHYSNISPDTAEPPALWRSSELVNERRSVMANVTKPKYTRREVDRAGDGIVAQDIVGTPTRNAALAIVSNWRSSHGYPTQSYHMTLLKRATSVDRYATVVQRLKRLPSIEAKLRRNRPSETAPNRPKMKLTQLPHQESTIYAVLTVASVCA